VVLITSSNDFWDSILKYATIMPFKLLAYSSIMTRFPHHSTLFRPNVFRWNSIVK